MAIVGVITARGGSKTIPRKSIAPCAGRPLISYSCEAALGSAALDHVILSSDDPEIIDVTKGFGVAAPFRRPAHLATDMALMPEVLAHALHWFEDEGIDVEGVVLLQPTSPLRTARHIDEAIALFRERRAETVVSLVEVPHNCNPNSLMKLDMDLRAMRYDTSGDLILRKQDKSTVYARNGPAVLIVQPHLVHAGKLYGDPTLGYMMDRISSIDVDDPEDLFLADLVLRAPEQRSSMPARA